LPDRCQAEYGADSDYLDDSWVPASGTDVRLLTFVHNLAPYMMDAAPWEWDYAPGYTPETKAKPAAPAQSKMATDKA